MIIYEETNNLVSGAFLKCFSILDENHLKINIITPVKYCCILHGRVCIMYNIIV